MQIDPKFGKPLVVLASRSEISGKRKVKNLVWRLVNSVFFPMTWRFHGVRRGLLRLFGASVGAAVRVARSCIVEYPDRLSIGENSSIGERCYILCLDKVTIGANVCISDGSAILSGSHDLASPSFALYSKPVCIGDSVWLAYGSVILPGVTLGRGCVVGAGGVVSGIFGDMQVLVGNPALVLKQRHVRASMD